MSNCINCKWFNSGNCNCKDFKLSVTAQDTTETKIVEFIEEGYLNEGLQEELSIKELANIFVKELVDKEYIKKAYVNKSYDYNNYNEFEVIELIDSVISKMLVQYFKNDIESDIKINDPYSFKCCYWE